MELMTRLLREIDFPRLARHCYGCSACAGGCPVALQDNGFNPRAVIERLLAADLGSVLADERLWLCAACHTCTERCPQGVPVSEILRQLRSAAAHAGNAPAVKLRIQRAVLGTGWAQDPGQRIGRLRRDLGLPDLPSGISPAHLASLVEGLRAQEERRPSPNGLRRDDAGPGPNDGR